MATTHVTEPGREQVMSGDHAKKQTAAERHEAAGAPARRAHRFAWSVFVVMAVTSMIFQVYHAITVGQMAWPLAGLEGVIPLALSIGILEVAAVWGNWKAQAVAYGIAIGAMYWSASATGAVTAHAGPSHGELVFGLILDGAALFAIAFINHGPTAKQAVDAVARREAEFLAEIAVARAENARQADEHRAALEAHRAAVEARAVGLRDDMAAEIERQSHALANAETALADARSEVEAATARADRLERKLTGPAGRSKPGAGRSGTALRTGTGNSSGTGPEDDLELEAKALKLLATDLDMSGAELARKLNVSEGYGRKLRRRLSGDRPAEPQPDRPENRSGTALEDRDGDRA